MQNNSNGFQEDWLSILQNIQRSAIQTATIMSIDAGLMITQILMHHGAHYCHAHNHKRLGNLLNTVSDRIPYGLLVYQSHTQGVIRSSVGFASAAAANQAIEHYGVKTMNYLMN